MRSFEEIGVKDIHDGLVSKEFSAVEIAQASLDAINAKDDAIHAFLEVTPDIALKQARLVDEAVAGGEKLGILAGVPCAFKDNMNQVGTHTTCASKMLEDYVSPYDATCVANAVAAGAVPVGKTNMDEFAFGSTTESSYFGKTNNPWDTDRVPGGSSGGSAAAVAAGMVPVSLGSDTGGSIRQPASFCGVVGLKPTYGVVSRYGVVAFGSSLDQVGPFARTVADAAYVLNAISGHDPHDCTSQPCDVDFTACLNMGVSGMKIGVVDAFMEMEGLSQEVKDAYANACKQLEGLGAQIVDVELPHAQAAISAYYVIAPCEAFSNLSRFDSVRYGHVGAGKDLAQRYESSRAEGFGPEAKRRIMLGGHLLASGVYDKYYYPAQQVRTLITQDYVRAFNKVDAIIMPTAPKVAYKSGEMNDPASMYLSDIFTISLNIAGNGGMSLPVGFGAQTGMPVGLQIIGPQFRDEIILRVGSALESCCGMAGKVAPFKGGAN